MTHPKNILYPVVLVAALASAAVAQERTPPPTAAFKSVHLLNMTPDQEAKYMAFIRDANQIFARLGCSTCAYHLYKAGGTAGGKYNHMMISDWSGRDLYVKLHTADDYKALGKKYPIIDEVERSQFYERFVEVK